MGGLEVLHPVTIQLLLGKLLNKYNLRRDENGGLTLLIGNGDFDERAGVIVFAAFEAQAALGHVFARNDVIAAIGMADASLVADLDARMLAAIGLWSGGFFRRRHGEDGGG